MGPLLSASALMLVVDGVIVHKDSRASLLLYGVYYFYAPSIWGLVVCPASASGI